jgi:hypothetical protein
MIWKFYFYRKGPSPIREKEDQKRRISLQNVCNNQLTGILVRPRNSPHEWGRQRRWREQQTLVSISSAAQQNATATSDENRGTVSGRSGFLSQFVTVNPILRIFPPLSLSLRLFLSDCRLCIAVWLFSALRSSLHEQVVVLNFKRLLCLIVVPSSLYYFFFQNWNATFVAVSLSPPTSARSVFWRRHPLLQVCFAVF